MTAEEIIKRLPSGKQRRMAMLSLAGVKFTLGYKYWYAFWWDGEHLTRRESSDLHDLLGYTYNVKPRTEDDV